MTKMRITTVAAIGGLTASIALLTGLPSARADELADLRANQELLQRRIDQLAQTAPGYMTPTSGGPVGVPMAGGSFPRSFLIPGTDTSIRIGGEIREIVDYWFSGGPVNASPQTTTLGDNGQLLSLPLDIHGQTVGGAPVPVQVAHSRGNGVFSQTPKESKLNIETRTPTAWGEARTVMEFDWAGSTNFAPGGANVTSVSDNLHPRLRYAYGTLGGFLAGQASSNFTDLDANAETIDFGGNVGEPGVVRIPQMRYTMTGPWGMALSMSAETPETDAFTPAGVIASDASPPAPAGNGPALALNPTKAYAPDLTFVSYWAQPWGHMSWGVVVRNLELEDGHFLSRQFIGYGGHVSGDVKPGWFGWDKDDITWHFVAGEGIGRYLNCSCSSAIATNFGAAGTLAANGTALSNGVIRSNLVTAYGGSVGYLHRWAPNLRSTASFGFFHQDIPSNVWGFVTPGGGQVTSFNKELVTAHFNLIWNPVAFIDVGLEYMYGHRVVVANLKADENALIGKFGVKF